MNEVTRREEITRTAWRNTHRDYKLTAGQAVDGVPKVLKFVEGIGTCLVPVTIVPDPKPAE